MDEALRAQAEQSRRSDVMANAAQFSPWGRAEYDYDPAESGRGPGRFGCWYVVELADGTNFLGRYAGVVYGTTKRRDKLCFQLSVPSMPHRIVFYEDLVAAIPLPALGNRRIIGTGPDTPEESER